MASTTVPPVSIIRTVPFSAISFGSRLRNGFRYSIPNFYYFSFERKHGAVLIENINIANLGVILDVLNNGEQIALSTEFKLSLDAYLSDLSYSPVHSLADVIAFNNAHPIEVRSFENFCFFS